MPLLRHTEAVINYFVQTTRIHNVKESNLYTIFIKISAFNGGNIILKQLEGTSAPRCHENRADLFEAELAYTRYIAFHVFHPHMPALFHYFAPALARELCGPARRLRHEDTLTRTRGTYARVYAHQRASAAEAALPALSGQ